MKLNKKRNGNEERKTTCERKKFFEKRTACNMSHFIIIVTLYDVLPYFVIIFSKFKKFLYL